MAAPVLSIEGLKLALPAMADRPYAVEDATLRIAAGETLCVVGESGSGKSMIAHAVMGLLPKAVKPVAGAVAAPPRLIVRGSEPSPTTCIKPWASTDAVAMPDLLIWLTRSATVSDAVIV